MESKAQFAGHALHPLLIVLPVTGWLGGELVERLGVGVDRGAHLDAPSSLSNEPLVIADTRPERARRSSQSPSSGEAGARHAAPPPPRRQRRR